MFTHLAVATRQKLDQEEASGSDELNPVRLRWRRELLLDAMHRREAGEDPHPDDARAFDEVEETPAFYGFDVAPARDMTAAGLAQAIGEQGGLGSSPVTLRG
ncbi:MAG TPA: hypothetical protein VEW07_06290 [Solirubrobacterales bacterium]|nr:hypothetical protein [Solirubrobacterales bacterium]